MDIFSALKEDHENIKAILRRLDETSATTLSVREREFANLHEELISHSRAEEEVFYKRLENADDAGELIKEAQHQHQQLDDLMDEMADLDMDDDYWSFKLHLLKEQLEHHIRMEERELFEYAGKVLREDEIRRLGKAFKQDKQSWKT